MKLAVMKEEGRIPGAGYHYMLMPKVLESEHEANIYRAMGHVVIEVDNEKGQRLLEDAGQALRHQVEIAIITDKAEMEFRKGVNG